MRVSSANEGATATVAGYAGDVGSQQAWDILADDVSATLVDVRTAPEWGFVGVPDLSALGRKPLFVSWQLYPDMKQNADFDAGLAALDRHAPIFFLCRSGARSRAAAIAMTAAGYSNCWNVAGGFEGDLDANGRRGPGGWKAAGLPWRQS